MKLKLIISIIAILLMGQSGFASRIITIQSKEYKVDTLKHVKVGPGTYYTALLYNSTDGAKSFRGFFLTMDMKNHDNVEYRMELGNDSTLTGELISSVAKRKSKANNYYFAAVNADFYITWNPYVGTPHMDCFMDGQVAGSGYLPVYGYGHLFMDYNKNMWCDSPIQSFSFVKSDNSRIELNRINLEVNTNEIVMFNEKYGHYTKTSSDCTEIAIKLADGEKWSINKPFKVEVVGTAKSGGNMAIEPNCAVLAAKGTKIAEIIALKEGDVLTMDFSVSLADYGFAPERLKECSGGDVVILKRGEVVYEADRWINGRDNNNPRTMLGYTESRDKMIWGLIDGRSSISMGCTYPEGADAMKYAGCYDAVNVDGGGSAGMYIQNLGIMNVPSDGKERAVSNGIYAVLKAPEDNTIAEIQFVDYAMQFPKYGVYKPKFYGYNKYGMLIDTDVKGVELSCPSELGEIRDKSTFIGVGNGTHALTASYGDIKTSMPVTIIISDDVSLRLNNILLDGYREYPIEVEALVNEEKMPIDASALKWNSEDASVATVDTERGIVKGVENGSTKINGNIGNFSGILNVKVEKPTSNAMPIDPQMDVTTWTTKQTGGKNLKIMPLENGMELTYTGASGRAPAITLTKDLNVWSIPDALRIRINPGEAPVKSLTISLKTASGKIINLPITQEIKTDTENVVLLPVSEFCDATDMINYPIGVNSITLNMGASTANKEYSIKIPGIEGIYDVIPSGIDEIITDNSSIKVTPNPITRGESINILLPNNEDAKISIYDMSGSLLLSKTEKVLANKVSVSSTGLPIGTVVVSIEQNGNIMTQKVIIK